MNNEIKEILFLLHNDRLTESGKRKLEDYITNLQKENERLYNRELELSYHLSLYSSEETMLKENKDLQQIIEKAVEYIKEMDTQLEVYGDYDILSDNKNDLLNILNGRSDE